MIAPETHHSALVADNIRLVGVIKGEVVWLRLLATEIEDPEIVRLLYTRAQKLSEIVLTNTEKVQA